MAAAAVAEWPYVWRWNHVRPERRGQPCKIVAVRTASLDGSWGSSAEVVVEFKDGERVATMRRAIRMRRVLTFVRKAFNA